MRAERQIAPHWAGRLHDPAPELAERPYRRPPGLSLSEGFGGGGSARAQSHSPDSPLHLSVRLRNIRQRNEAGSPDAEGLLRLLRQRALALEGHVLDRGDGPQLRCEALSLVLARLRQLRHGGARIDTHLI